jgi:hypothetical protein
MFPMHKKLRDICNMLKKRNLLKSTRKLVQIDRKSVGFIKFIFEAYDGLAGITTIDPIAAKIVLNIAPGSEPEVEMLLNDLKRNMIIRRLEE